MTTELTETRNERIAELVAHLTGCHPDGAAAALAALRGDADGGEPLALVARAVHQLTDPSAPATDARWQRPGTPEGPSDGLRLAGYLRVDTRRVIDLRDDAPRRPDGELRVARYVAARPAPKAGLAEHSSLRRWERTPPDAN